VNAERLSGDALATHVLEAIEHALQAQLYPELQSADSRFLADMMVRLLRWLALRQTKLAESSSRHEQSLGRLLGADSPPQRREALEELVAQCNGSSGASGYRDILNRFIEIEATFLQELDPEGASSVADNYEGGRLSGRRNIPAPIPVNDETVTRYLRARFPECPRIRATGTLSLVGGLGKDTILFVIEEGDAHSGGVVMRKDLPISPIGVTVVDEFPLLTRLAALDIPVPIPLWAEHSAEPLGTKFIVVRQMPGSIDTTSWIKEPRASRRFASELARTMARIHALTPQVLGRAELSGRTAAEGTRQAIVSMLELYRRNSDSHNLRLEAAFGWLLANIPDCAGRAAHLVHGDIGFHNLLMKDGQVTAILDWEFGHFGDPAEDVSYCRPFVERVLPWKEFIDMYHAFGGAPYTQEQDRFYAVWRNARNAASCVGSRGAFMQAEVGSVKLATGGIIYGPRFEIEALRSIAGGAA
jgi:aminoglycoside phosphotransferase (APT) family kinase protein